MGLDTVFYQAGALLAREGTTQICRQEYRFTLSGLSLRNTGNGQDSIQQARCRAWTCTIFPFISLQRN